MSEEEYTLSEGELEQIKSEQEIQDFLDEYLKEYENPQEVS